MEINENTWKFMKIADFSQKHQRYAHWSPKRAPKTPKVAPGEPKWAPRASNMPQNYTKMTPKCPKWAEKSIKVQSCARNNLQINKKIAIVAPSALLYKKSSQQAEYDI